MFKLICFALLISCVLSIPIDGDEPMKETTIDDFDNDDWGLDDFKSDSQGDSDSKQQETAAAPEVPSGPVSYIQKIPRRGEKPSTELPPVEIAADSSSPETDDQATVTRSRRDTLTREQRKEQKRLAKKNKNKENTQGQEQDTPSTSTKRPRKQKQQKKPKLNVEDEVAPINGGHKKQRNGQGGKKNKEGKQKNREGRPTGSSGQLQTQGQGKNNGQRNRKQRPTKQQQQPEGTLE